MRHIKALYPFGAGSTGPTMLHQLEEKPVEPTTLRQLKKEPARRTTPPKPKKNTITRSTPPKPKKKRIRRTEPVASQEQVSTRKGSPEDVPLDLRVACEAIDFVDLRRFIDDCLMDQENELGLDCPQSEEAFLGLLEILRAKAGELTPLTNALPRHGIPSATLPFAPSERLLALRTERIRLEAGVRAAERDRPAARRSIRKLRRKLERSIAEVTALEKREREEHIKRQNAAQDPRWRRAQIVARVERDIRRAFKFGAPWPTRRLPWRLLPPGELTIERLRYHYQGLQHHNLHIGYDWQRLEKTVSLRLERCYVGTDEFEGYVVFTFARTERALLECPVYGNAIYVLGPDWRRLSKLSKQELLSGRTGGVTKIVHTGDWFRRARLALEIR